MQPLEPRPPLEDDHLADEQLMLYQAEALSPADREQAEAHFRVCREGRCARRLGELWAWSLGTGAGSGAITPVPPALDDLGYIYEHEVSGAICTPPGVSAAHDVYLALRIRDRLRVVVKFLPSFRAEAMDPAQARLRFIEEPAATHQLRHPNIVSILDFHSINGRFFYVMQNVGPSLSRYQSGVPFWARLDLPGDSAVTDEQPTAPYLSPGSPPFPESPHAASPPVSANGAALLRDRLQTLARWVIVLAETIEAAHRRGILHRDLKPDNILVQEGATRHPQQLLITDFGILHHLNVSSTALEPTEIGTPGYMAPEQLDNTRRLSPATDIYGLGGVFYFMLTGQPPLLLNSKEDWKKRVGAERPKPPRELQPCLPVGLQAICLKALEKEQRHRYQTGAELAEDVKRFVAGRRPWALYPPLLRGAVYWRRRNPQTAVVIGALGGLLTTAVVLLVTAWMWYTTAVRETARAEKGESDANAEKLRAEKGESDAKDQKVLAEAEKLRAENNEAKAKEQARDNLRQAARFALSRGQRLESLVFYDLLLPALPAEEQVACRVERLPCLFAYSQWHRLLPELAALKDLALPPKLRAQVLLHDGDVALWRLDLLATSEGRKHLTTALSIADGLRDADAEYARGLLADGCLQAIQHYEKALALDAFHPRARVSLLFELIFSGQFEAAERQLEIAAASFPQEPLVPAAGVCLTTFQQRPKDREPFLERLRQQLPDDRFQKMKKIFAAMDEGIKAGAPEQGALAMGAAVFKFVKLFRLNLGAELGPLVGVATPIVRRPREVFGGLAEVYLRFSVGNYEGACTRCAAWSQKSPEAWFRLAHAMARGQLSLQHEKAGNWAESCKESARVYELVAEARRSPTILPSSGIHREAAWFCLALQAGWLETRHQTSRSTAMALLQAPGVPGSSVLSSIVQLNAGLTRLKPIPNHYDRSWGFAAAMESHGLDAKRSTFLPAILFFLPVDDGRFLLSDWEADEPRSIVPLQLRAKFEFAQRNWPEARRYAQTALARQPQNMKMRKLLEQLPRLDRSEP